MPSKAVIIDPSKCRACGCCVRSCPVEALSFAGESVRADETKCILCLQCAAACPFDAISPPES